MRGRKSGTERDPLRNSIRPSFRRSTKAKQRKIWTAVNDESGRICKVAPRVLVLSTHNQPRPRPLSLSLGHKLLAIVNLLLSLMRTHTTATGCSLGVGPRRARNNFVGEGACVLVCPRSQSASSLPSPSLPRPRMSLQRRPRRGRGGSLYVCRPPLPRGRLCPCPPPCFAVLDAVGGAAAVI